MDTLVQDVRFALRRLAHAPGFTAVVVVTLALGIGANSAIFSVVNSVLLTPLPYADPSRLVLVWERKGPADHNVVNPGNYLDWKDRASVFSGFAAVSWANLTFTGDQAELVDGRAVTPDFFGVLGVAPALGRTFTEEESRPHGPRVIVLSNALWRRRFGADPAVVGRAVPVAGGSATVVGVMPPSFRPLPWGDEEYWEPMRLAPDARSAHSGRYLMTIARLKKGVTLAQAQADLDGIARNLARAYPDFDTGWSTNVVPLTEQVVGKAQRVLWLLFGAVTLVLLIACANVANLALARALAREKDLVVRAALGASRWRLIRQGLVETGLLGLAGGGAGLLLASWGVGLLVAAAPDAVPRVADIRLDPRVVGFTMVVALGVGLLFGLPAAVGWRRDGRSLHGAGARTTHGASAARLRDALVIVQTSLAIVLLVGAGLLVRSLRELTEVEPGFDPTHVSTVALQLPVTTYPDSTRQVLFYDQLLQRLRSMPGIAAAGITSWLPMAPGNAATGLTVVGRPAPLPGQKPDASIREVDPGYFAAMDIPLRRGRLLALTDRAGAPPVAVISEAMARRLWPGEDPVGQHIKVDWTHPDAEVEVVGIVGDVLHDGLDAEAQPTLYYPFAQEPQGFAYLALRSAVDPAALTTMLRSAVSDIDREVPVRGLTPMTERISGTMSDRRYPMMLISLFALLALVIAAVGLYGLLAYAVGRRTQEFGVRMALGAAPGDVLRLVLRSGLGLTLAGIIVGWLGGWGAGRALGSLLYDVHPTDPVTFAAVGGLFLIVALAATLIPARRAARVDPMVALRSE